MKRKGLLLLLIIIILCVSLIGSLKEGFEKRGSGEECRYDIDCESDTCMRGLEGRLKCALRPEPEIPEVEVQEVGIQ